MNVYSSTNIGKRSENQDFAIDGKAFDVVFAIVCDGMGGSKAGKEASKRAATLIKNSIERSFSEDYDANKIRNLLVVAVKTANAVVHDLGSTVPEWNGMGTTCVVALRKGNMLHVVNVGDSRAYLITHEITQITRDHSLVVNMYEQGQITKAQMKKHPQKNVITRAVGAEEDVTPDYFEMEIPSGGVVMLCTDGLSNHCDDGFIFRTIKDNDDDKITDILVKKALENGARDNITVSIIK